MRSQPWAELLLCLADGNDFCEVIPVTGLWAVNTHVERSRHLGKVLPHRKNRDRTKKK